MNDVPAEEGRSQITTHDVQDTIGWILPGLMRVFFSSENLGEYEPENLEDEQGAKQATDYINYVIMRECDGYQVFWDVFHDALLHANGVVKHWWDDTPTEQVHVFRNLTEEQFISLTSQDEVEILAHEEKEQLITGPDQQAIVLPVHDVKIKRSIPGGCLKIAAVPPEEFLIDNRACDVEDARFVGQRTLRTRSDLIAEGYDKAQVDKLPMHGTLTMDGVEIARQEEVGSFNDGNDRSMDLIEVTECYIKVDHDRDGVAEMLRVVVGGPGNGDVLDWEVWEDEVPFTDFVAERVPHRWQGRSVFDDVEDIQRTKTVLLRQLLDNLYQANIPDRIVDDSRVVNKDALYDRSIGNVLRVQGDPNGVVSDRTVPFVAKEALTGLGYMDEMIERRTGVSRSTMALDLEALQNQSATAVNAAQSAAYSKIELIARNFAEMGFKRFFRCALKIIVQNQDRAKTIRLRNQWVEMDPSSWNANMDFTVNVGLGSGSKDRDVAMLMQIAAKQEMIISQAGPTNPIAGIDKYANTLRKMIEALGIRNPDQFFGEVDQQTLQVMANQPEKPDPKAQAEQAKVQIAQQKAQADALLQQQKMQAQLQAEREKAALMLDLDREKAAATIQLQKEQSEFNRQQRVEEAHLDAQLRRDEMILEAELTREANALNAALASQNKPDTNIERQKVKGR
ncbi:hypothetical protein ACFOLL_04435 [Falsochrobactrum ovis]